MATETGHRTALLEWLRRLLAPRRESGGEASPVPPIMPPPAPADHTAVRRPAVPHVLALCLLAGLAAPAPAQLPPMRSVDAIAAADSAATSWLGLLAAQGYVASWEQASPPFQHRIRREDWTVWADAYRDQFQRTDRRRLVESYYRLAEPPLQEPGEYVTLRYATDVSPERRVSETLLLIRDPEGVFRVADYVLWPNVNGDPILEWPGAPIVRLPPRPAGPSAPPPMQGIAPGRR